MTEKDVMFRVLYNPRTKEVYTNPKGDVFEFYSISELKTATKNYPDIKNALDNDYEVFAVVENYTPILNSSFDDVFNKHCLVYSETFCHCDRCGKLFLQDVLSFTDKGAPYCSKCYELYETYDTYFQCLGLDIVSRGDYEGLPIPMRSSDFSDDKMAELAKRIYLTLTNEYGYTDRELENYFNDTSANVDEDLDMAFWKEMEEIAVQMGMRYYEDIDNEK